MEHKKTTTKPELVLPISIATKVDVGRLLREVSGIDEFLEQASIRQPGSSLALPKTTKVVDDIVSTNKVNLLVDTERKALIDFLTEIREKAPEIHMSFSAEPSASFMQKLTTYLRENIHPHTLVQVGLQPTIGAGFMMRTTNKYYDFSLRTTLKAKHQVLIDNLRGVTNTTPVVQEEHAK